MEQEINDLWHVTPVDSNSILWGYWIPSGMQHFDFRVH